MLISLALFALIAVAGLSLIDTVLGVEERTAGRLDRSAAIQRAMLVLTRDVEQMQPASLRQGPTGVGFRRVPTGTAIAGVRIDYRLEGGALVRVIDGGRRQTLLAGVEGGAWRFFLAGPGWQPVLPAPPAPAGLQASSPPAPAALALDLRLSAAAGNPSGILTRVIALPAPPPAPPALAPAL